MFHDWQVAWTGSLGAPVSLPPELILPSLILGAALLLGAVIIAWVKDWRKERASRPWVPEADLDTFHSLYAQGQLSREELERIHARLASRVEPCPPPASADPPPSGK